MITTQMTAEAEAAAQRYTVMLEAWRGLYANALSTARFGSEAHISDLLGQAYAIARRFLETEQVMIADASTRIASEAHRATLVSLSVTDTQTLPERVTEHLGALADYLRSEIAIQIERDIATLRQSIGRTRLQIALASRAKGVTEQSARLEIQFGGVGRIDFYFHDRRAQKWPSVKFIRAVWRQHLLASYNETALIDLADHGIQIAEIWHPSPSSHAHGMRIAMSASTALPTYEEVRNEVFHPNSDAIIQKAA